MVAIVAGRHPLKQGLKQKWSYRDGAYHEVAGRHPLKQGLKPQLNYQDQQDMITPVAGRHPLKQGLKH